MTFFLTLILYIINMKRFKTYPKINFYFFKIILIVIFILIGFFFAIKVLFKTFIKNNDERTVNRLLAVSTNNLIGNISLLDLINFDLTNPETILKVNLNNFSLKKPVLEPVFSKNDEPLVYIYNTHQTEEYAAGSLKNYNITPTVYMASNILKAKLDDYGIVSIVEGENMRSILSKNNYKYKDSYKVSRNWVINIKKEYPSIKYFIDLHRNSSAKSICINDIDYTKLMFVVGKNHDNYKFNESLMKKMTDALNEKYPGLCRDVYYSNSSKYNQDLGENAFLIEVGGPDSTIDEVYNSISAFAEILGGIINGTKEE